MSSKTTTKVGDGFYRETVRNNDGSGKSTVSRPTLFGREVKSTKTWTKSDKKGKKGQN